MYKGNVITTRCRQADNHQRAKITKAKNSKEFEEVGLDGVEREYWFNWWLGLMGLIAVFKPHTCSSMSIKLRERCHPFGV